MPEDVLDLTCPQCGGTMEFDAEKREITCPFCNHKEVMKYAYDADTIQERAYARQQGVLKANAGAERRQKRRAAKAKWITLLIVFGFVLAGVISYCVQTPRVDPFENISVNFSGVNGSGRAEIVYNGAKNGKIDYDIDPDDDLSVGDVVTVKASSSDYRLSPSVKSFTVEGLDMYLTDLDALSDNAIEMIHNKSDSTVKMAADGAASSATLESLTPHTMYLITDGQHYNTLYDIYLVRYRSNHDKVSERYVVAYYKNVVVRDTEEPTMQYESTMYTGNIIQALDDAYGGYITGYNTLKDVKADILSHQKTAVTLKERKTDN